ncbi:galactose oxidase, partial [Dichomitus squalens]
LYTIGDIPPPRFGQAGACAGSVAVVWGGDTTSASSNQLQARAKYDNGLYFLNLVSREWTRITVSGAAPKGRIGHSVVMIGPKIYVFGGEADGRLFNDLWCFDLSTLVSKPAWEQIELPKGAGDKPAPRSGHICVAYKDQLIIFGGSDRRYHYNDTWAFDTTTKAWCELPCTGYIPAPREGHAAALVDDIVYIFGGRGVRGADIGELAAFKISSKRWFTFQNMGPEPAPRSGHGMAAVGSKVYVLGGVCEGGAGEADVLHVLETSTCRVGCVGGVAWIWIMADSSCAPGLCR